MADAGWLGITMPEEYGGSGLGVTEAAIMMHEVASHGGGMAAASAVHINLFGPHPIVVKGTPEQKARWVPRLVAGEDQCCFGFTEPDAGLNTTRIKTFAQKVPGGYLVHGQKVWTSTAQVANKIMLLTRTTKYEDCARPTDGITIFYTDLDRSKIDVHRIPEDGPQGGRFQRHLHRRPVHSGSGPDRRGGQGLLLHPAQPQSRAHPDRRRGDRHRPGCAAPGRANTRGSAWCSTGRSARTRASSIRWPRTGCIWSRPGRWRCARPGSTISGQPCGAEANAAKFLGARAGHDAAWQAIMTHGGFGYAKEYHVERLFREVSITRLAPITEQLILSFIAEKVLDLPKSY